MKQFKITKRRMFGIVAFLAVLGLAMSLFAETAGGVNLHTDNATSGQSMASYKAPGQVFGDNVDLNIAGTSATATAANFTNGSGSPTDPSTPAVNPGNSDNDTSQSSQTPSSDANDPSDIDSLPPAVTPPIPTPTHCECPVETEHDVMLACPDDCIAPNPVPTPGCHWPCSDPVKPHASSTIMCPVMVCME